MNSVWLLIFLSLRILLNLLRNACTALSTEATFEIL
ncbi:hypothetical protein ES288_A05G048500v1 [Gossypium darwinii]|uniref:Uncharacterized protein n=1 Tax=Gossypium darwinii TaxID=34276 RepID=A0A5D2GCV8_GOSDA|nr:hypothetical protein ES288_A05G048500v1 [Gossypium darwinii]